MKAYGGKRGSACPLCAMKKFSHGGGRAAMALFFICTDRTGRPACTCAGCPRSAPCSWIFFKQKTAYEIKECDWSSDVCSSDLLRLRGTGERRGRGGGDRE